MRIEMQKAQQAEQRLRIDRDEWRLMAENLQAPGDADAEEEGDDEHDEDSFHDAHDGGHDPEPDDDDPGDSPSKRNRWGPGPDPLMEMIQMEVMIQSTPMSRFRIVKQTRSWFLPFPR